jgi:hypothetical protein
MSDRLPFLATTAIERTEHDVELEYDEAQDVSVCAGVPVALFQSGAARTQTFTHVIREQPDSDPSIHAAYLARARTSTMTKATGEPPSDPDPQPRPRPGAGRADARGPGSWRYDDVEDLWRTETGSPAVLTRAARDLLR